MLSFVLGYYVQVHKKVQPDTLRLDEKLSRKFNRKALKEFLTDNLLPDVLGSKRFFWTAIPPDPP